MRRRAGQWLPWKVMKRRFTVLHFTPTAKRWRREAWIGRYGSGTCPQGSDSVRVARRPGYALAMGIDVPQHQTSFATNAYNVPSILDRLGRPPPFRAVSGCGSVRRL